VARGQVGALHLARALLQQLFHFSLLPVKDFRLDAFHPTIFPLLEHLQVSPESAWGGDAFKIRRIYRKLARKKGNGSLRRITVFVRHENVVRLLGFLGYCLE
jgi:hypothetical protein